MSDIEAESYYYGCTIDDEVSGKATEIILTLTFDKDSSKVDKHSVAEKINSSIEEIIYDLEKDEFDTSIGYGRGYSHAEYDGTISDVDDVYSVPSYLAYGNEFGIEIIGVSAKITDKYAIQYIDESVTGDTQYTTFELYDVSGDQLDMSFDNYEDALEYAKKHSEVGEIVEFTWIKDFHGDTDIDSEAVIWNRDIDID